jgi:hypothetical protein
MVIYNLVEFTTLAWEYLEEYEEINGKLIVTAESRYADV